MYERERGQGRTDVDLMTQRAQDLVPLKKLDGWRLSKDTTDIRGMHLFDRDNNDIGRVDDLLMSRSLGEAVFALVGLGGGLGRGGKRTLIPLDMLGVDRDKKRVLFDGIADHIHRSPDYRDDIEDYNGFYDHWGGLRTGAGMERQSRMYESQRYVVYPESFEEEEEH